MRSDPCKSLSDSGARYGIQDLPADIVLALHLLISVNIAYKNTKSQWVVKRLR